MFTNKTKKTNTENLEKAIGQVLEEMTNFDPSHPDYQELVDLLEQLYKIRGTAKRDPVSYDNLIAIGGNLAGIVMILNFERFGAVTSKALSFVIKSKV